MDQLPPCNAFQTVVAQAFDTHPSKMVIFKCLPALEHQIQADELAKQRAAEAARQAAEAAAKKSPFAEGSYNMTITPREPPPPFPRDLPMVMHGMGVSEPTANLAACEKVALKWGQLLLQPNQTRPATCEAQPNTVWSKFEVEKACPPNVPKDSDKCMTHIVRPPKGGPKAGS